MFRITYELPPSYVFSIGNLSGVVAANNWLTLVNPVGSGKLLNLTGIFISSGSTGASASTSTMRGVRVTDVSGGTSQSGFANFVTAEPVAKAEVRINNPTMTVGNQILNVPPPTSAAASSNPVTQIQGHPPFILAPGEGFGLRTESGDTAQRWNISVVWVES